MYQIDEPGIELTIARPDRIESSQFELSNLTLAAGAGSVVQAAKTPDVWVVSCLTSATSGLEIYLSSGRSGDFIPLLQGVVRIPGRADRIYIHNADSVTLRVFVCALSGLEFEYQWR